MALGAIAALDAAGKTGEIQVVGFDNIPGVRQYIADGAMLSTVEQFGADMAKFGIDFGLRELAGEKLLRLGADAPRSRHRGERGRRVVHDRYRDQPSGPGGPAAGPCSEAREGTMERSVSGPERRDDAGAPVAAGSRPPLIEVRDLSKEFPGVRALDAVSMTILAGEVHALVGENGAGKSTLVKILSGVEQPDGGEMLLNGAAVPRARPRRRPWRPASASSTRSSTC